MIRFYVVTSKPGTTRALQLAARSYCFVVPALIRLCINAKRPSHVKFKGWSYTDLNDASDSFNYSETNFLNCHVQLLPDYVLASSCDAQYYI